MHAPSPPAAGRRSGRPSLRSLGVAAALALLPSWAGAVPITGELSITGSLVLGSDSIDFVPAGGGSGSFTVGPPASGSFAALAGTSGALKDLDAATEAVGAALSLSAFMTFAAAPNVSVTLSSIEPGVFGSASCFAPPAAGQTCTVAGSSGYPPALSFVNTRTGTTFSFDVTGQAIDSSTGEVTNLSGAFTAQVAGLSFQQVPAALASGGSVGATYSASFVAVVPEPATG